MEIEWMVDSVAPATISRMVVNLISDIPGNRGVASQDFTLLTHHYVTR